MVTNAQEVVKAQLVAQNNKPKTDIKTIVESQIKELSKCLPSDITPERMCRVAINNYRQNTRLTNCTVESFIAALFQSAQLGLEPGIGGQAYLIPYGNKVNFQIGYKGLVKLFYRNSNSISLDMQKVCENDVFEYELGTNGYVKHIPTLKDRGEVIAFYAIAALKGGEKIIKIMSKAEAIEHGKKHSKAFNDKSSPWQTEPDAMCMKTVLVQLMKVLPNSIEIQRALDMDNTTKSTVKEDMLAVKDETDWSQNADTMV